MFSKIKQTIENYKQDRRRTRFLERKLELLIDPTFLDRALADGRN